MNSYLQRHSFLTTNPLGMAANALLNAFRKDSVAVTKAMVMPTYSEKITTYGLLQSRVEQAGPANQRDAHDPLRGLDIDYTTEDVPGLFFFDKGVQYCMLHFPDDAGARFEALALGEVNDSKDRTVQKGEEVELKVWKHLLQLVADTSK